MAPRSRGLAAALLAVVLAACQATAPSIETTDPRVTAGAQKSCDDLGISDVRCTLVVLRAARELDAARPGHARVTGQQIHEAGPPPAGQSPIPSSQVVAAVVVFTLEGGSKVGVPVLCPREPSTTDQACNPQVE